MSVSIAVPIFITFGLYRAIFRYSGWPALVSVTWAVCIYGLIFSSIYTAVGIAGVPRTVGLIQPILLLLFVGSSRAAARFWLGEHYQNIFNKTVRAKVLIYGAGKTGRQLAAAMTNNQEMTVVGFVDDDEKLHRRVLDGKTIYDPTELPVLTKKLEINNLLIAMPSRERRNQI